LGAVNAGGIGSPDIYMSEEPSRAEQWSPLPVDQGSTLSALACPSIYLCVAFDRRGKVIVAQARRLNRQQVRRLLAGAYTTRAFSIRGLLQHGGVRVQLAAPIAGAITVRWLLVPSGGPHPPVLIAKGEGIFEHATTKPIQIALTRAGRSLLRKRNAAVGVAQVTYTRPGLAPLTATRRLTLTR
jgi:hypothetical protein